MASRALYQLPSDQVLDDASLSLGTGAAAAGYALSDLHNGNPAFGLHLTAATAFNILLDYGASVTKALKFVSFHNHNFDPGTTIFIQGNATNSWGAPTVNQSVVVPADAADGFGTDFFWALESQTTALRWWRIGSAATNSAAWILGQLWCSTSVRTLPVRNFLNGTMAVRDLRRTVEHETPTGVSLRYQQSGRRVVIEGSVEAEKAGLFAMRDWNRACIGKALPTPFVPFEDVNECHFVVHDQDEIPALHADGDIWNATIRLRGLSTGPGW